MASVQSLVEFTSRSVTEPDGPHPFIGHRGGKYRWRCLGVGAEREPEGPLDESRMGVASPVDRVPGAARSEKLSPSHADTRPVIRAGMPAALAI